MLNIKYFFLIFVALFSIQFFAQEKQTKIVWDRQNNIPIQYATINSATNYSVSNENGYFEYDVLADTLTIKSLYYNEVKVVTQNSKENDTVFMVPKAFELEEIIIDKDDRFKTMVQAIPKNFALEPHKEKFFLRVILKKNSELYKIVDLAGKVEKQTLFDTKTYPMPKKNYKVEVDNIRKAGIEDRQVDYELLSFENFLTRIASVSLNPKYYDFSYKATDDLNLLKIQANPKNPDEIKTKGYYLVNNIDNAFKQVKIFYNNPNAEYTIKNSAKYRTAVFELESNFEKNNDTQKFQLNFAIFQAITDGSYKDKNDVFEVTYIYMATPIANTSVVKKNINLSKDIFDLNIKYNDEFWKNNEKLPLTFELQEFINKVNTSKNSSDFKTKTNIK
jgi:hypothetical protein